MYIHNAGVITKVFRRFTVIIKDESERERKEEKNNKMEVMFTLRLTRWKSHKIISRSHLVDKTFDVFSSSHHPRRKWSYL